MSSPAIYPIAVASATAWIAARVASCPVLACQPTAVCVRGCPGAPWRPWSHWNIWLKGSVTSFLQSQNSQNQLTSPALWTTPRAWTDATVGSSPGLSSTAWAWPPRIPWSPISDWNFPIYKDVKVNIFFEYYISLVVPYHCSFECMCYYLSMVDFLCNLWNGIESHLLKCHMLVSMSQMSPKHSKFLRLEKSKVCCL